MLRNTIVRNICLGSVYAMLKFKIRIIIGRKKNGGRAGGQARRTEGNVTWLSEIFLVKWFRVFYKIRSNKRKQMGLSWYHTWKHKSLLLGYIKTNNNQFDPLQPFITKRNLNHRKNTNTFQKNITNGKWSFQPNKGKFNFLWFSLYLCPLKMIQLFDNKKSRALE